MSFLDNIEQIITLYPLVAFGAVFLAGILSSASPSVLLWLSVLSVATLFDVGRIARVDLLKVQVQLANERQRALSYDEAIATTDATLRYLMGDNPSSGGEQNRLTDTLVMPKESIVAWNHSVKPWTMRPEYQSALLAVNESELARRLTFGRFLPTVNAVRIVHLSP